MEQSHWEAIWFAACQGFPRILLNPKIYYLIHKYRPLPILSQFDLVRTTTSHFLKIHHSIILHLCLGLLNGPFILGFLTKTLYTPFFFPIRSTRLVHLILLDLINLTIFGEHYKLLSSLLCSFLHSPVTTSNIIRNNFHITLFSNTLSLHSSLNMSDHVLHPYKQQGKLYFCVS
jgi:hypothetical protein